jgi:hypothetical protein
MDAAVPCVTCYLAEWYRPQPTEELLRDEVEQLDECITSMCAQGSPVQLLMTLAIPTDELVIGVFTAGSEQIVARVCRQAGIELQRLSVAIDPRPAQHSGGAGGSGGTP